MQGLAEMAVSPIRRPVGRTRINGEGERITARFPESTLDRMKTALAPKETQNAFIREAVERELTRRAK